VALVGERSERTLEGRRSEGYSHSKPLPIYRQHYQNRLLRKPRETSALKDTLTAALVRYRRD
jgi:hypothetical protein